MLLILTTLRRLCLPVIVFLAWAPVAQAWSWPVQGPVLEPFAYDQAHPYAAGQHRGVDIGAETAGETVVAPAPGRVDFAGTVPTSGQSVTIATPDGYSVTLTHLGTILVSKGAAVTEGEAVGTIGPSGTPEVDAPYVHLGIRVTADPNGYVDPLSLLPAATAESPPTESAPPPPAQPTASGSPSAAPVVPATPAPAPAPTAAASAPAARAGASTVAPTRVQTPRHQRDRAHKARGDDRPEPSSERPASSPLQMRRPLEHRARLPHRRPSKPKRPSRRPVVEVAAPREATVLDAGLEIPSQEETVRAAGSKVPVPLVLNGAAALVALAAAFAATRRRVRPGPAAEVLELPGPAAELRRAA